MSEKELAKLTSQVIEKISARISKLEARQITTDLLILSLIQTHQDHRALLTAIEASTDPAFAAKSNDPEIAAEGIARLREYLELLRKHVAPASDG